MELEQKTQLHNPQALFNLIRILEEYLINKSRIFVILLLPLDILISGGLLLSYTERIISYRIVGGLLRYIQYDLLYIKEFFLMIINKKYVSEILTEKVEEKDIGGTIFRKIQRVIKLIWSFIVLIAVLPIFPIMFIYDFLAPKVMVGFLYYAVIFFQIHLYYKVFIFIIATFLVASTTVPWLFSIYVYVKYLFELRRSPWSQIKEEATTFFIRLYNYNFHENENEKTIDELEGGLYLLFLKFIHKIKDYLIIFYAKYIIRPQGPHIIKENLNKIREKFINHQNRRPIKVCRLIGPLIACIITFGIASFLVMAGSHGQGIIGSFVLSIVDIKVAQEIWTNYQSTGGGYFEYLVKILVFLPNFLDPFAWFLDFILHWFFLFWHSFYPLYWQFTIHYYEILYLGLKLVF